MAGMAPSLAFHGINQKMHEAMNITYTGNAEVAVNRTGGANRPTGMPRLMMWSEVPDAR
jgi:hypothetical protein